MALAQKNKRGETLIKQICCPRNPTKTDPRRRWTAADKPELFLELYSYCAGDIAAENDISIHLPELSEQELAVFQLDLTVNTRGVQVDMKGLADCLWVVQETTAKYTAELRSITGIEDVTINKLKPLQNWIANQGVPVLSMAEDSVTHWLTRELPPAVQRVLELRQLLGSAAVKKLYAIERSVNSDGRLRGLYAYYGARQTGRFAGRGPQPQNMPSGGPDILACKGCGLHYWVGVDACPSCGTTTPLDPDDWNKADWGIKAAERALADFATRSLRHIEHMWGNPIKAVSGCLRSLFIAAPGKELICSDYTAIEAVVLAALAGEEWRLEVFRTHGKIYEASASKISGIPLEEFIRYEKETGTHHPLRKKIGKVAELASGYQGWINAWKNFGADKFMNDEEIKQNILRWRDESPNIVEMWGGQWRKHPHRWEWWPELYGLEGAAVSAITNPGYRYTYRSISYYVIDNTMYCELPSGRCLTYHKPELRPGYNPLGQAVQQITFEGWNSDSSKGPVGWIRIETYGGKLTENVVQAVARDIFVQGLLNVEGAGYPVVLHTHDEPASEVPIGFGSVEEYEALMCKKAPWYADWPIKAAGGWRGLRYRKD